MGGGPVDLNARAVFRVQVVQVPIARRLPYSSLPFRDRQSVGSFHCTRVPEFKHRQRAIVGLAKSQFDLLPPTEP